MLSGRSNLDGRCTAPKDQFKPFWRCCIPYLVTSCRLKQAMRWSTKIRLSKRPVVILKLGLSDACIHPRVEVRYFRCNFVASSSHCIPVFFSRCPCLEIDNRAPLRLLPNVWAAPAQGCLPCQQDSQLSEAEATVIILTGCPSQ